MVFYARKDHPLAGITALTRGDLDQFPLVSIRVPKMLAGAVPGQSQVDPESGYLIPSIEIDDLSSARSIVASSNGLGVAIPTQIEKQLESGEFAILNYQQTPLKPTLGFVLLKNRTVSSAAEVYMQHVVKIEDEVSARVSSLLVKYRP